MKNPSPSRLHRLAWLAMATLGTLLLLPATRYLLRMQMQMEALTYSTRTDLPAERAAAARLPADYPVQLALATEIESDPDAGAAHSLEQTQIRNRRIAALAQRFPNNPSVYANLLRYMTLGEIHLQRDQQTSHAASAPGVTVYHPSPESLEMFIAAAQKGAALDSDNAYFPMMQAIGLLAAYRDSEALDALKTAGRCSQWKEYFQDEVDGRNRLQTSVYGEQGALRRLNNAAMLPFPQYSQLRTEARVMTRLIAEEERAGNTGEAIAIRHALMRCGGLMRAQGSSYITSLVGIAIAAIATSNPGGDADTDHLSLPVGSKQARNAQQLRAEHLDRYYAYLEKLGRIQEAAWAKTEIAAGDQARAIRTKAIQHSVFDGRKLFRLGLCWLVNNALLSGTLVVLLLGAAAHLAGHVRPRKALTLWRGVYALLILGGIGVWQWQATQVGTSPYIEIQSIFSSMSDSGNGYTKSGDAAVIQRLAVGLGLLVPELLVGLVAALSLFQRVPLATGLGRGLRGTALPAAAVLFVVYGLSLLPTVCVESAIKTDIARMTQNEPRYLAEISGKAWPGDPQP